MMPSKAGRPFETAFGGVDNAAVAGTAHPAPALAWDEHPMGGRSPVQAHATSPEPGS